ncbi:hypothetical protein OFB51_24900, partial [Escherichia coli]|nr:hypothetical protein [Escherichia coli]
MIRYTAARPRPRPLYCVQPVATSYHATCAARPVGMYVPVLALFPSDFRVLVSVIDDWTARSVGS